MNICICAPGPSLTQEAVDIAKSNHYFMIMVGNAYRMLPHADVLYHADAKWWEHHDGVPLSSSIKISAEATPWTRMVQKSPMTTGLDPDPRYVVYGGNSGYQALNIAFHYNPRKIILLGFDMKKGPNGEHNIDGDHPKYIKKPFRGDLNARKMRNALVSLELNDITVYNCSLDSAIDCFPKKDIRDAL